MRGTDTHGLSLHRGPNCFATQVFIRIIAAKLRCRDLMEHYPPGVYDWHCWQTYSFLAATFKTVIGPPQREQVVLP